MLIEHSLDPNWLSNTYLIAAEAGSTAALIDCGGPLEPLLAAAEQHNLMLTTIFLTHHHHDHISELDRLLQNFPDLSVYAHPLERELIGNTTVPLSDGDQIMLGELKVQAVHTPGHTAGMLSFLADDQALFTGDTLFRGSVGGVRAPGHTTFSDLKNSIMQKIMQLPDTTTLYPGHTDATTVAQEWEHNAFIRIWRGLDPEGKEPCTALGEPATLVLRAPDYDGGTKAWVRWPDGSDDIVPGSRVS